MLCPVRFLDPEVFLILPKMSYTWEEEILFKAVHIVTATHAIMNVFCVCTIRYIVYMWLDRPLYTFYL